MKIVILNHSYLTPEHIRQMKEVGEVIECPNTTSTKEAIDRISDAEIAIADCFELSLDREFFSNAKSLKYLCLNTTGFNLVDIAAAKEKSILISNLPGFSTEAVAEHAIALMFAVSKNIVVGNDAMHKKPFQLNPAIRAQDKYTGTNLRGKTLGIIGLGKIGVRIAELGNALGMNVIAYNRTAKKIPNVKMVDLDSIYIESDVIIPAMAFNEELRGLIGKDALGKMKSSSIIVNVARGELIDEKALTQALIEKRIGGLGADVISDWSLNNPLLSLDNVVLTPHMAFLTDESLKNMADLIVSNVKAYIAHKPANIVNS